jgi:hypothetical protein
VASVTVSPAIVSVYAGATQQLTATPKDAAGTPLSGRVVTWASNAPAVATVNGSGLVTGVAVGTATITATSEIKSGSATVTVVQPAGGAWPNEPAGLTPLTDQAWTAALSAINAFQGDNAWTYYSGDLGAASADVFGEGTGPLSPPNVLRFTYLLGDPAPVAALTTQRVRYYMPPMAKIYVGFWIKASNSAVLNGLAATGSKVFYLNTGIANHQVTNDYWMAMDTPNAQNNPNGAAWNMYDNTGGTTYFPNVTTSVPTLNVWHRVEIYAEMTGVLKWWIDGVLNGSYANAVFRNTGFDWFSHEPIRGNLAAIGTIWLATDYFWVDHTHISGQ